MEGILISVVSGCGPISFLTEDGANTTWLLGPSSCRGESSDAGSSAMRSV
jgi:hypothetical protein